MDTIKIYGSRYKKNGQVSAKPFFVASFTFEQDAREFVAQHNRFNGPRNQVWAITKRSNGCLRRVA